MIINRKKYILFVSFQFFIPILIIKWFSNYYAWNNINEIVANMSNIILVDNISNILITLLWIIFLFISFMRIKTLWYKKITFLLLLIPVINLLYIIFLMIKKCKENK